MQSPRGMVIPPSWAPKSTGLNEERKQVIAELEQVPPPTDVVTLHSAMLAHYEAQLTRLQDALAKGINSGDSDCAEAMRDLIETVTVFRDASRLGGVQIEITGRLNALLGEKAYPNGVKGVWGKVVAEVRLIAYPNPAFPCSHFGDSSRPNVKLEAERAAKPSGWEGISRPD